MKSGRLGVAILARRAEIAARGRRMEDIRGVEGEFIESLAMKGTIQGGWGLTEDSFILNCGHFSRAVRCGCCAQPVQKSN